jgi:hypothetical protein
VPDNPKTILLFLLAFTTPCLSPARTVNDTSLVDRKQLRDILLIESTAAATSLAGLSILWYSGYQHSSFHFINDNNEWLQSDKLGHVTASYFISRTGYNLLRIPGVESRKAVWYGGALGFVYLGIVELMDGFSDGWGASMGDVAANAAGSASFIGQQLAWGEQRILFKWSFHGTKYAKYNPSQLGSNLTERMIKDYNGQTFWLSANISSFLGKGSGFPEWLNIAAGYSADGVVGARYNPAAINGITIPEFRRTRQFFLAPDIDLTRIRTDSHFLRTLFNVLGVIKLPLPALEYNSRKQFIFHPVYF